MKIIPNLLILFMIITLGACSNKNITPIQVELETKNQQIHSMAQSKNVQIFDTNYVGATIKELDSRSPEFDKQVTFTQRSTIIEIAQKLEGLFPTLSFQVKNADTQDYRIYYKGDLKGLLDAINRSTGYGWTYSKNTIVFSTFLSKTYTIQAIAGKSSYSNTITNMSKEESDSPSTKGIGETVSTTIATGETAQTTTMDVESDVFKEIIDNVKGLLSEKGKVSFNQIAGTITVYDKANHIAEIDSFIEDVNEKLSRQVAINVQVWSLDIIDSSELGFNLNMLFEDQNIALLAGNTTNLANNLTASIVSGNLKGSKATLQALKQLGNASNITSASGIVMNNTPLPALAVKKQTYIASLSSETTDYGQSTEVSPGEITTGFAMTVIPHILEKRELILQYNINVSSLDDIERFNGNDVIIDLPQTSTRSFAQRMRMKMGQTLVLSGYQQDNQSNDSSFSIFSGTKNKSKSKSLLIITIQVENADI